MIGCQYVCVYGYQYIVQTKASHHGIYQYEITKPVSADPVNTQIIPQINDPRTAAHQQPSPIKPLAHILPKPIQPTQQTPPKPQITKFLTQTLPLHLSSLVKYLTTLSHAGISPSRNNAATSTFNGDSGLGSVRSWCTALSVDESV